MGSTPVLKTRTPQPTALVPQRSLAGIIADAVVEEHHVDDSVITQHPVEEGATIADHAYDKPRELTVTYAWAMGSSQNSDGEGLTFLRNIYTQLRQLKSSRVPFTVVTGKDTYQNMLIVSIQHNTDRTTENVLLVRIVCQEVILVQTQVVSVDADAQNHLNPEQTSPIEDQGLVSLQPGTNYNSSGGAQ